MASPSIDIGLLVLRGNEELIRQKLKRLLAITMPKVRQKLYVHLEQMDVIRALLPAIYINAASIAPKIDLRVLLNRTTSVPVTGFFMTRSKTQAIRFFRCFAKRMGQHLKWTLLPLPITNFRKSRMTMSCWAGRSTDCTTGTNCCSPRRQ
ncbi:hypothetical protein niasHT_000792 [Heterodera trifolii]|uniref:Uncharacterized protein n=1 Tax=Heterodera trifolii TaxID=157864 RepID=A0ABD2MA36_9BILA